MKIYNRTITALIVLTVIMLLYVIAASAVSFSNEKVCLNAGYDRVHVEWNFEAYCETVTIDRILSSEIP